MTGKNSRSIAFCGVMGALMVTILLMGNLFPMATYCAPMMAGLALTTVAKEKGRKLAWVLYLAVSLLSSLMVADVELTLCFIFVAGPYPMIQAVLEKIPGHLLRAGVKTGYFSLMMVLMYGVLMMLFPGLAVIEPLAGSKELMIAALFLLGLTAFWAYDRLLVSFEIIYRLKLRPRLKQFL